jgi:hypothetical protein
MSLKIKMKVTGVSRDAPNMPGMSFGRGGPFSELSPFVFLSLVPAEQRKIPTSPKSPEKLLERPSEKVRIKSEEGERDAEIIRPMAQWNESMLPSIPVVVTLSMEEFEGIGRPTLGDKLTLTIEKTRNRIE